MPQDPQGPPAGPTTVTDAGSPRAPTAVAAQPPLWLGPYRLLRLLGEGGMGQVWLAQQEEPVQRQVAIKVIKAGMDTRQVVARFESERQALALMSHPAIAQVFDGGSTPEGRPYFVMEHVAGTSITEHCDREQLSVEARLALLIEVCAGVQHAHQKAILHRDLKPSNILVARSEGRAQPKIIDFGIAKALGERLTDTSLETMVGAIVGTPEYMSPEQADPTGDIDTRADVYSLGVILYELLTGQLPFSSRELRTSGPDELRRKLRDVEPPRPSVRLRDPETATTLAVSRRAEPGQLRRLLKGDLDAVTMKALEKDRARRYGTPSDLAADLERYLRNEPVIAQPPSAGYRARKYVERNKLLVAGVALLFVVLAAGVVVSALQAQRARRAERKAASEAAVAKATSDFLQRDLLGQADVGQQSGDRAEPDIKVRTVLDRAAANIEGKFTGQPAVEASIRATIGEAYQGLGLYPQAHTHLERALEVSRSALGAEHAQTLAAAAAIASLLGDEGKYPQAEALLQETLSAQERVLGPEDPATLRTLVALGGVQYNRGERPESQATFTRALELQRRVLGPEHRETLATLRRLGSSYTVSNQPEKAEPLLRQALEAQRRLLGPEHNDTLLTLSALSVFLMNFGRQQEAAPLLEELVPLARRSWGSAHPRTLAALLYLASVDAARGRFAEAEAGALECVETGRRALGPEHPRTLEALLLLGTVYLEWGRFSQAEAVSREALDGLTRVRGPEAVRTLDASEGVAASLWGQGKLTAAAALYERSLEVRRRTQGRDYRDALIAAVTLAEVRAEQGHFDEAMALLTASLEPLARETGAESESTLTARRDLAQTLCWQGDESRAAPQFAEVIALARRALGAEHTLTLAALQASGECAYRAGKLAEAAALLAEALQGRRRRFGGGHPLTLTSALDLARALHGQGKFTEAEASARTALEDGQKAQPDAWQTHFAESVLGACLAGQQKLAAARPLLAAGLRGLEERRELIPVPERERLDWARAAQRAAR